MERLTPDDMENRNTTRETRKAELERIVRDVRRREALELIDAAGLRDMVKDAVADALDQERKKRGEQRK